jgi:DNA-binding transcriptional ArsR family regulator
MVKHRGAALDATFHALADPIRRSILMRLEAGEASVTELARPFRVSLPAISKHIRVLEKAGLLRRRRAGRVHSLRLAPGPLREAAEWIEHYRRFWEARFDALDRHLQETLRRQGEPEKED